MRTRWKVSEGFWTFLGAAYMLMGLIVAPIGGQAIFGPCTHSGCGMGSDNLTPMAIGYGVFWGPPLIVVGVLTLRWLWSERPRRVTEPVTTDLREASRDR